MDKRYWAPGAPVWVNWTHWLMLAFVASFFVLPSAKWVNNLFYAGVCLPFFIWGWHREVWAWLATSTGRCLLAFWSWCAAVAAFSATDPGTPLSALKHLLYMSSFFCAWQLVGGRRDTGRLLPWLMLAACLGEALLWYAYVLATGELRFGDRGGLPMRLANSNHAAAATAMVILLALGASWVEQRYRVLAWVSAGVGLFLMLFLFQSRSALIGLLLGGCALVLTLASGKFRIRLVVGALTLLALFALGLYAAGMLDILLARGGSYRGEIYGKLFAEYAQCHWWMGCGYDYVIHSVLDVKGGVVPIAHPHSIFLAHLLYTGAPGLLLLVLALVEGVRRAFSLHSIWIGPLVSAIVVFSVESGKLLGNPDETWLLLYLPLAMVACAEARPAQATS